MKLEETFKTNGPGKIYFMSDLHKTWFKETPKSLASGRN
jgi:YHS domain-containing protein